jgi:hypothetical protein
VRTLLDGVNVEQEPSNFHLCDDCHRLRHESKLREVRTVTWGTCEYAVLACADGCRKRRRSGP